MPLDNDDPAHNGSTEYQDIDREDIDDIDKEANDEGADDQEADDGWEPSWRELTGSSPVDERQLDVEALRELLDSAEVDAESGEVTIWIREIDGLSVPKRVRSLDQLREVLSDCGWETGIDAEARRYGVTARSGWVFTIDSTLPVSADTIDEAIESSEAKLLFQRDVVVTPSTSLYKIDAALVVPATKIELAKVNDELIRYLTSSTVSLKTKWC